MLHTLLSRQFWPGNISPGHHSSGPILKLRRREGIPWLERVVIYCCDIYCCCETENDLSAFSCLVTQRATHQVARCWSLAAPAYGGGCGAKLQDVCLLAPSHDFGWHLPLMCSILGWEGGAGVELKASVGVRKICTGWACPNRRAWAGLSEGERGTASSLPTETARSCSPHLLHPHVTSEAILVRHQRKFGHQGPNPLTVRFLSTLPNRATLSRAILCGLC